MIAWSALRGRRAAAPPQAGRPGGPGLHLRAPAAAGYGLLTAGLAAVCAGLAASQATLIAVGGGLLAAVGIAAAAGLSARPLRVLLTGPRRATAPGRSTRQR